jgi:hypothetical protein
VTTFTDDAVSVPDQVKVTGPGPYTDEGMGTSQVCPEAMVTDRDVTARPSTFGTGIATVADADEGPTMTMAMLDPVGQVSTAPVVGRVPVSWSPAWGADWTA